MFRSLKLLTWGHPTNICYRLAIDYWNSNPFLPELKFLVLYCPSSYHLHLLLVTKIGIEYIHIYTHTDLYAHICIHTFRESYRYTRIYIYTYMEKTIYVSMYGNIYSSINVYIYIWCIYTIDICRYIWYSYIYIYQIHKWLNSNVKIGREGT